MKLKNKLTFIALIIVLTGFGQIEKGQIITGMEFGGASGGFGANSSIFRLNLESRMSYMLSDRFAMGIGIGYSQEYIDTEKGIKV